MSRMRCQLASIIYAVVLLSTNASPSPHVNSTITVDATDNPINGTNHSTYIIHDVQRQTSGRPVRTVDHNPTSASPFPSTNTTDDPQSGTIQQETSWSMESSTHSSFNSSKALTQSSYVTPDWQVALDTTELVMTSIGLAANLVTFIALGRHSEGFSTIIRLLLMHQAIVDSMVCVMAIAILIQPYMWLTGVLVLDYIICQAWHGQALYWGGVLLSVWNLVFISVERFITVCKPFHAPRIRRWHIYVTFVIMYVSSLVLLGPAYLQVRLINDICSSEYYFEGLVMEQLMTGYGIFWFFIAYAIPCSLFCVLYTRILLAFRRRKDEPELATSRVIDNASKQLTKTAIIVTIVFIISLGWDSWTYILGYAGVVEYEFNSPTQKIGVFLSVMNSCANPFIYAASMPVFRNSLLSLFCCNKESDSTSAENTMSVSTVSIPLQ